MRRGESEMTKNQIRLFGYVMETDYFPLMPDAPPPPPKDLKFSDDDIKLMFEKMMIDIKSIGSPLWHANMQKILRKRFNINKNPQ